MEKLCLFIAVSSLNCFAFCLATDEEALLAFKTRITSDPNKILAKNWSTNTSICDWIGVSCSRTQQRVTALNFSGFGFKGTIAPHLGNLTFLSSLDISSNNFTGINTPRAFSPELLHIVLSNNNFSGSIPVSLGNLSTLETLDLQNNQLTGFIPVGIFNISSLRVLDLKGNTLSGRLPEDIRDSIPKLEILSLSKNKLSGQIPSNIFKCKHLEVMSLSNNQFNGSIPSAIGRLTVLRNLYLGTNNFRGMISSLFYTVGSAAIAPLRSLR